MNTCKMCHAPIPPNRKYCSRMCSSQDPEKVLRTKQTNLERYGVEQPTQNININNKRKQTNIERYGADNPRKALNVQQKIEETNLKKYGVRRPAQNKEIQQKIEQTKINRYGAPYNLSHPEFREKWEQVILERYGVTNPTQNAELLEKQEQTNLERYGVRRPAQNKEIQQKIEQTKINRYGDDYVNLFSKKRRQTNYNKYGIEFHVQKHNINAFKKLNDILWVSQEYIENQKPATQLARELNVTVQTICNYLHIYGILTRGIQKFSHKAIQWLEYIMRQEDIFIQHAHNVGEYRIPNTRLSVDGYCEQTNTIYEFHGDMWHGNPNIYESTDQCHPFNPDITSGELYQKTIERENQIKNLGYNLVTIWENEWEQLVVAESGKV